MQRIALLGSTGSIGTNCLDVVRAHADRMQIIGLSANRRWQELSAQAMEFQPAWTVLGDATIRGSVDESAFPPGCQPVWGLDSLDELVRHESVDTVVSAIVGAAGLRPTWAAVDAGKRVALANKETLVVAGPLIQQRAAETGAVVLPVDSEHNAIFQALAAGNRADVRRIVLTASGGPFRGLKADALREVTPQMALEHPTWKMGPKISVDSATMMNKALEIIEARWLFDFPADRISVMIHPQSVIHSLVEFRDGSVIAQLSPPDMRLPIQYALTFPDRLPCPGPSMDWTTAWNLELLPPDEDAFPALRLGHEVARKGGTCGAVLNAANEVAVDRFLNGDLRFDQIPQVCQEILNHHNFDSTPTLHELEQQDQWAREETKRWIFSR